jgi:hypothetical protein
MRQGICVCLAFLIAAMGNGCASHVAAPVGWGATPEVIALAQESGLTRPAANLDVMALVMPPRGWRADPLKSNERHKHQVWVSPTGDTAYGVIHFQMPLPVGDNLALMGFIRQMAATEGDATLVSQENDDKLPGIRFVAEGGRYRIRANLITSGFEGWAIYAGTLRGRANNDAELLLAQKAREQTKIHVGESNQ